MMFSLREIFGLEMKPRLACSLYCWDLRVVLMMRLFEEFCFCFWGDDSLSYLCDHLCWRCLIFPPYIYQFLSIIQVSLWLCPFICFCLCPFCLYCFCWDFLGGYRPLVLFLQGLITLLGGVFCWNIPLFLSHCDFLCSFLICAGSLLLSLFLYIMFLLVLLLMFLFDVFVFVFFCIIFCAG